MQLEGLLNYLPYHHTAEVKKHGALNVNTQNTTHPHPPTTQHILIGVKKKKKDRELLLGEWAE